MRDEINTAVKGDTLSPKKIMWWTPKTLQQRLTVFLLFPVAVLLFLMGLVVFVFARDILLAQWREAAVLKLQHTTHIVDMRLKTPKSWMEMFHKTAGVPEAASVREWVLKQLEDQEGIARVQLTLTEHAASHLEAGSEEKQCPLSSSDEYCLQWRSGTSPPWASWMGKMKFERVEVSEITHPRYDELVEHETISLASDLLAGDGHTVGKLEVVVRFQYLIEGVISTGWAGSEKAFLVSADGKLLACNVTDKARQGCYDETLRKALHTLGDKPFGTLIRPDDSRDEVVGFYRLSEAPWTLVLVAPSDEILASLLHFQRVFFVLTAGFLIFILLWIRWITGRTVSRIRDVSSAAQRVARGQFDALPAVGGRDEVAQLIDSFNEMVGHLDERICLKAAMDLAVNVQQNLLPQAPPSIRGLDIAGKVIYCDETGGDYFDYLPIPEENPRELIVAVGDVAGHGISAALFMTTARALLRSRALLPGSLADVTRDLNRLLSRDTSRTGDFMSLFLISMDIATKRIRWVRAGHPPALIFDREAGLFEELRGEGVVLGVDEARSFQEYAYEDWNDNKILLLGTDGIWETEDGRSEHFGMERLRAVIREKSGKSSQEIIEGVVSALSAFRGEKPQEDDVTMVVISPKRDFSND